MKWTKELESGASIGVAIGSLASDDSGHTVRFSLSTHSMRLETELTEAEAAEFVKELALRFGSHYRKVIHDVAAALKIAKRYGGTDEGHHKAWVIDQMVRALTGDNYEEWVRVRKDGVAGPDSYPWDEGIAP